MCPPADLLTAQMCVWREQVRAERGDGVSKRLGQYAKQQKKKRSKHKSESTQAGRKSEVVSRVKYPRFL